jgi:copper homeostasis protein
LIPVRTCLEVCVDSIAGLDIAVESGADRIELCSALDLAGLTPSRGLMALAAAKDLPCYVLIRPRAGDFCYGRREIDVMRGDIDSVRSMRLAGVVIGASLSDGTLDEETLRELLEHADGLPAVLHRAFDLVPDFQTALEAAIRLGFKRVLTSGGAPEAVDGSAVIGKLVEQARDRIEVMAGAGLSPENVAQFVRATRVPAVHASCRSVVHNSNSASASRAAVLGFVPAQRTTDAKVVMAMVESLNALAASTAA